MSLNSTEQGWRLPLNTQGMKLVSSIAYRPEIFPIFRPSGFSCCHGETSNGGIEFGLTGLSWINWSGASVVVSPCSCATSAFCNNELHYVTEGWFQNGSLIKRFDPDPVAVTEASYQDLCNPFLGVDSRFNAAGGRTIETVRRDSHRTCTMHGSALIVFPATTGCSI